MINQNNIINGFLLDTTWRIMQYYTTSILNASISNTSLPIGFIFGSGEKKKYYTLLIKTVEDQFHINFHHKVIESDQGPALLGLCSDLECIHLACLRHFFAALKWSDYAYQLQTLVSCTSKYELDNSFTEFSNRFDQIYTENPDELKHINKALKKIGCVFDLESKKIQINKFERWNEISMLQRINYKMPSTTNSLESMHGHLNKRSPRNNSFYSSIYRIQSQLSLKYINFDKRL